MSETLDGLPTLKDIINSTGLAARKKLGQNFLFDLNLTARIAKSAGDLSDTTVIEIGPGPGGLTRAILMAGAKKVIAIEHDPRCIDALAYLQEAYPDRLEIIPGDALKIDVSTLAEGKKQIIANLPYNVATPLLIGWLRQIEHFDRFTLMFQKEVADRIVAVPSTKAFGRLSIISQWLCQCRTLFSIPPQAFTPAPKVVSAVVQFMPRKTPLAEAKMESLEQVTAAAFGQRRKMLRQSLKSVGIHPSQAGLDETARAETLSVEDFCKLARLLDESEA